jgi:hypothetical protein
MLVIQGSELSIDPVKYDGGSQGARDAFNAVTSARVRTNGRGRLYTVTTTRAGAEIILDYCDTVGSTFLGAEPDERADGRALLRVAATIRHALKDKEAS